MATFVIAVLIVYALSWCLVYSDGAWGLLERFKNIKWVDSFGVLNCVPCTSFWISLMTFPLFLDAGMIVAFIISLGVWGAVVVLEQVLNGLTVR